MKPFFTINFVSLVFLLASCITVDVDVGTKDKGVDIRADSLYREYMKLSTDKHIVFKKKVSVVFGHLDKIGAVGVCERGETYRKIEVDINYWNKTTKTKQMILLFHELNHCYCGRNHDYGNGIPYPEAAATAANTPFTIIGRDMEDKGFFDDGCPVSLMYPQILKDSCTRAHYSEYIEEMFKRCRPY